MSALRVELFFDEEAGNWHYRVPALHLTFDVNVAPTAWETSVRRRFPSTVRVTSPPSSWSTVRGRRVTFKI